MSENEASVFDLLIRSSEGIFDLPDCQINIIYL